MPTPARPWALCVLTQRPRSHGQLVGFGFVLWLLARGGLAEQQVFGIPLDQAVEQSQLGASLASTPGALLLTKLETTDAATDWHAPGHWWYGRPVVLPKLLRDRQVRLLLAIDGQRQPFWLQLRSPGSRCAADLEWLHSAFRNRYAQAEWFEAPSSESAAPALARFWLPDLQVAFSCSDELILEYLQPSARLRAYIGASVHPTEDEAEPSSAAALRRLQHHTSALIRGDEYQLTELFGLPVNATALLATEPGELLPLELERYSPLQLAEEPLLNNSVVLASADDSGALLRLVIRYTDTAGLRFDHWERLLKARFSKPKKDRPRHQIYRFGSQRLILRRRDSTTELIYLDVARQQQQRKAAQARAKAQFDADTQGL